MIKLGSGGGVVFLLYSLIAAIVAPIQEHSFRMKLLKKLYFVRVSDREEALPLETKEGKPTYDGDVD